MADRPEVDAQWHDALGGLTALAVRPVTVVAMPPPDRAGRVSAGHGAMVTLSGILGLEPEGLHLMIRPAQDAEDAAEPG